jgi:glycosyltransferase involved in cell wall biosynthesis
LKYRIYIVKRQIEDLVIYPFIAIGRSLALVKPIKKEFQTFYFFPFYHTGGAEKVHALIAQATGNSNCIIYFTRKSYDKNFYNDFVRSGCVIKDISKYTDSKSVYFLNLIFRGIISGYINSQKQRPLVFNGQCNFGYKISPWINKETHQVELIHSFNTFSWIRIPFLPFIFRTVMISQVRIEDHIRQYEKLGIPAAYKSRIKYIVNGIPLPALQQEKDYSGTIKVLFAGRGTEEKRLHLVARMAVGCFNEIPAEFFLMGDVKDAVPANLLSYCIPLGHKSELNEIDEIYRQSHVIIITSYTEGFPMVIEEAMARGCVVMATPVGDIPIHIKNKENGFLFSSVADEALIVDEGIDFIALLDKNRKLLKKMGDANVQYAYQNFSIEAFNDSYQQLFNELRNK